MGYSVSMRDIVENFWKGVQPAAPPATWYVALLTTNPSDDAGTGLVEVSTGSWASYARQPITASTGWSAISGTSPRSISNANTLTYDTTTVTGTITVTGFAIYSAVTAGTMYGWAAFAPSAGITQGTTTTFAPAALVVQE